jgi:hypothetical protein
MRVFKEGCSYFFSNKLYMKDKNKRIPSLIMDFYAKKIDGMEVRNLYPYHLHFILFEGKYFSILRKWCVKKRKRGKS